MNCCQCQGIEEFFTDEAVNRELTRYLERGPDRTTRWLLDALIAEGVQGLSLLDIGGGVGAVHQALLEAGAAGATDVDAARAYLTAAGREAQRRGLANRVTFEHGDFVTLAPRIDPADIVTLDRVICCYDNMEQLVNLSAGRARKLYGAVYPRDGWLAQIAVRILNLTEWLRKTQFRTFVHSNAAIEDLVTRHGLTRKFTRRTVFWQVAVWGR